MLTPREATNLMLSVQAEADPQASRLSHPLREILRHGLPAIETCLRILGLGQLSHWHLTWEMRCCSKPGCTKCPHGPYLFARRQSAGVRKTIYLGR